MRVTGISILKKAQKGKYAVPAFNVSNLEGVLAIMRAAEELKSPLFISTSEGALQYAGMDYLGAIVNKADDHSIPIAFHLDHGKHLDIIKEAVKSGYYSSIMIDGSALNYKDNVKITKQVVAMSHKKGISVEAELGAIRGTEDFVSVEERDACLTDPEQAKDFVSKTGCDSLAVAIGTAHGAFKFVNKSKLDIARLQKINMLVKKPLVLHGASSVPQSYVTIANNYGGKIKGAKGNKDSEIKKAIASGICKVNIDTDLRIAYTAGIRKSLFENRDEIDPREYGEQAMEFVYQVAKKKIELCGCSGKA